MFSYAAVLSELDGTFTLTEEQRPQQRIAASHGGR